MACSGATLTSSGSTLFSRRPNSRVSITSTITGKIGSSSSNGSKSRRLSSKIKRRYNRVSSTLNATSDNISSVATLLNHTEIFPSKKIIVPPSSFLDRSARSARSATTTSSSSCRSILGQKSINNTPSSTTTTTTRTKPINRIRQLHACDWGGKHAGDINDGFVNIKVKNLRTNKLSRIAEYCKNKICVIDFWMTKHGGSPLVSMDA